MADAQVTLTNVDTAEKRSQRTDPDGLYSFVNLVPGKYRVEVEKAVNPKPDEVISTPELAKKYNPRVPDDTHAIAK